ncbi:MAG: metallophosphoesterase [Ruminococcus sp.]|nr:metallophosphoesterase [Ruminococcus sp.]
MKSRKIRRIIIALLCLAVILILDAWGFSMKPVSYTVSTDKLKRDLKVVFISDLHNCFFGGTDQSGLWEAIEAAQPDIVLFGGDVIDAWGGTKYAVSIMKKVHENYPCAYTPGNHEDMREDKEEFFRQVSDMGIPLLLGDRLEIDAGGQKVRIYGVQEVQAWGKGAPQIDECYDDLDEGYYNILLAHQPEQIDRLLSPEKHFDLILSGHAHGGQWRLPVLLDQGLYAPDQGIFPKYTSGQYQYGGTEHIISRGLARPLRMMFIPRIFNRPELSVITVAAE